MGGCVEGGRGHSDLFFMRFQGNFRRFSVRFQRFWGLEGVLGSVLGSLLEGILGGSWRVEGREKGGGGEVS